MRLARLLAGAFVWLAAALLLGALVPVNAGWRPATGPDAVTVWLDDNGVHAFLTLPVAAAGVDWRGDVPDAAFGGIGRGQRWLAFGWGERDFYLNTPTWAEVRLDVLLRAAMGSGATLVHVDRLDAPPVAGRPIRLTAAQYRRLAAFIAGSFARRVGATVPLPGTGYGDEDAFFEGRGRYSVVNTCNQWVRDALAHAEVRVGSWTPMAQSLMWRFEQLGPAGGDAAWMRGNEGGS